MTPSSPANQEVMSAESDPTGAERLLDTLREMETWPPTDKDRIDPITAVKQHHAALLGPYKARVEGLTKALDQAIKVGDLMLHTSEYMKFELDYCSSNSTESPWPGETVFCNHEREYILEGHHTPELAAYLKFLEGGKDVT